MISFSVDAEPIFQGRPRVRKWMEAVYRQKAEAAWAEELYRQRRAFAAKKVGESPNNFAFSEKTDVLSYMSGSIETKYAIKGVDGFWGCFGMGGVKPDDTRTRANGYKRDQYG